MSTKELTLDQILGELGKAARKMHAQQATGRKRRTQEEVKADADKSFAEAMERVKQPIGSRKAK
jgi:hypothetical protein